MTNQQATKTVAIMQPYFFPYIGYFQLINAVDEFIIYDNIKYTKKGWINRNRVLNHGSDVVFSLPLKKASDALDIRERELAAEFNGHKLLNQLRGLYRKAPQYEPVMELVQSVLMESDRNLFRFLRNSVEKTCRFLGISTPLITSSTLDIDHSLQSQDKVIALCQSVESTTYINPIGGVELYSRSEFSRSGIKLAFLRSAVMEYPQFDHPFVPWLSIIDVMMFNSPLTIQSKLLPKFELI